MDFFIDESGHGGDRPGRGAGLGFGRHPVFSLVAIGVDDSAAFFEEVWRLRARHGASRRDAGRAAAEKKTAFVQELVEMVVGAGRPHFIEVVDKRYRICVNVVSVLLLPVNEDDEEDPDVAEERNQLADWLCLNAPDHVLVAFLEACRLPGCGTLRLALDALAEIPFEPCSPVAQAVRRRALHSLGRWKALQKTDHNAHLRFLPRRDRHSRGDDAVWRLPRQSSLTNLYTRINLFCSHTAMPQRLVHDDQLQFDGLGAEAKTASETLGAFCQEFFAPTSSFVFEQRAPLVLNDSDECPGLRIADTIASFVMRQVREFHAGRPLEGAAKDAIRGLLTVRTEEPGTGTNFVMPGERREALHEALLQ